MFISWQFCYFNNDFESLKCQSNFTTFAYEWCGFVVYIENGMQFAVTHRRCDENRRCNAYFGCNFALCQRFP